MTIMMMRNFHNIELTRNWESIVVLGINSNVFPMSKESSIGL